MGGSWGLAGALPICEKPLGGSLDNPADSCQAVVGAGYCPTDGSASLYYTGVSCTTVGSDWCPSSNMFYEAYIYFGSGSTNARKTHCDCNTNYTHIFGYG